MQLGETTDSIYSTTFNVESRIQGTDYPLTDSAKLLTMIDGTLEWVDFGARIEYTAELSLIDIVKTDYFALTAYIKSIVGSKIRFTTSNDAENPWTDPAFLNNSSYFYATVLEYSDNGEEDFTVSKSFYSIKLKISYTGKTSSDIPNIVDTSLKDILMKIDTVRATVTVADKTTLDAVVGAVGGWIGFTTSDHKKYIYDASDSAWKFLYTVVADNPAYGLVNGIFYLSAFADISSGSPGISGKTYKAGLINSQSIKFANSNIDISSGPAIEKLEGFSFSANNVNKFFNFIISNNISLYNALVESSFYDRTQGIRQILKTGINYNNTFNYHDYQFQVGPEVLSNTNSFPLTLYTKALYPNADVSKIGTPVIATFGRWQKGEIQPSNFTVKEQKFSNNRRFLKMVSFDTINNKVTVDIATSEFLTLLNIGSVGAYPGSNAVKYIYAQILQQEDQPDLNKLIRINAIAVDSSNTKLTLAKRFAVDPSATAVFQIFMSIVELVADNEKIVGLRAPGYLSTSPESITKLPLELYAKVKDTLEGVPDSIYNILEDGNENRLTITANSLDVDNFGVVTVKDAKQLTKIDNSGDSKILTPSAGYFNRIYDFGFIPDGIKSEKLKVYVESDLDNGVHTTSIASADRITVAWSGKSTGKYRLLKYKFPKKDLVNKDAALSAVINIASNTTTFYVDTDVADTSFTYYYRIQPTDNSFVPTSDAGNFESGYKVDPKFSSGIFLKIKPGGASGKEATLIWNLQAGQTQVKVYRNDVLIQTIVSTTQTYYQVNSTGADGIQEYYIQVSTSSIGNNTDSWFIPDGTGLTDLWGLKTPSDPIDITKYLIIYDKTLDDNQLGYRVNTRDANNGSGIPAAGIVFTWMMKLDKTVYPDLTNAKDVRLLTNFIVRSYIDDHTQIPVLIQLRGVKADGSSFVLCAHSSSGAGLAGVNPDINGAFAAFVNLPLSKGGLDADYDTEQQTSNVDGKYTGKDMWRLPDWLFIDNAAEWQKIEYFCFVVTNAVPIIAAAADSNQKGYKIGMGPLPGITNSFVQQHKNIYYIEYVKEFTEGLDTPQFARIDGGKVDDGSGTYTGTAGLIIETGKSIANYIVKKLLNYKPLYIGDEMKSRDNWLCRFQPKDSRDLNTMLQLIANNLFGCFIFNESDKYYIRSLDIDEPKIQTVLTFNDSNVIKDSVTNLIFRKNTEIFQQFKFKYNYEPSTAILAADPNQSKNKNLSYTEEIVVGWDILKGSKIIGGYSRIMLGTDGNFIDNMDGGDENKLADLCKISAFLNTADGKLNQFGYDQDFLLEFFYRPTQKDLNTGWELDIDLPNVTTIHNCMTKQPKKSIQDLIGKYVRHKVFNAWTFSFKCNMKYITYDTGVSGIKDEAGTAEHRLKLMDKVIVNLSFHTNGLNVQAFVVGIEPDFYNGMATITVFAPKPPGQLGGYVDPRWDAGFGTRVNADFVFPGNDYGLNNEPSTFADAGNGTRTNSQYKFPDGTTADSEGEGTGKN